MKVKMVMLYFRERKGVNLFEIVQIFVSGKKQVGC